jgi:ABC-type proline/glycine betaine transport system permease subunit
MLIALPVGIVAGRNERFFAFIRPLLDAMQVMPAFVYLVPVVALFNVGRIPGVIAAVVYALPPGIRLTALGIREVPPETIEAAKSPAPRIGRSLPRCSFRSRGDRSCSASTRPFSWCCRWSSSPGSSAVAAWASM